MFIGLMGLTDEGVLVTPKGTELCRLPFRFGILVQRVQHAIAARTWR